MSFGFGLGAVLPQRWVEKWELASHKERMRKALLFGSPYAASLGIPDPRPQGGSQACFGFAGVQAIHQRKQALGLPSRLLSPVLPYWWARKLRVNLDSDVVDEGSDPDGMRRALAEFGACDWDRLPFDETKVNQRVGHMIEVSAQKHLCTLEPILEVGSDDLWRAIQYTIGIEKKPVIIALRVTKSFDSPTDGVVDDPSGADRGLHAQCLNAFDPEGALNIGSWAGWGGSRDGKIPKGCVKLTPRFLKDAVEWAAALEIERKE